MHMHAQPRKGQNHTFNVATGYNGFLLLVDLRFMYKSLVAVVSTPWVTEMPKLFLKQAGFESYLWIWRKWHVDQLHTPVGQLWSCTDNSYPELCVEMENVLTSNYYTLCSKIIHILCAHQSGSMLPF